MKIVVTGGAGFIGSALIRHIIKSRQDIDIINIDKLTYAGNLESLGLVQSNQRYIFRQADVCDGEALRNIFREFRPAGVIHLAAESHVDRSIDSSREFIDTNINGTYTLLEESRRYLADFASESDKKIFRFHHVSTDEVYGSLGKEGFFTESTAYDPNSPYSASKAASDHLAIAWHRTYGLPVVLTNCSNNYGPYQFPEKLIPLMILNALEGKNLPVYGDGSAIRDWLYVDDHVRALLAVFFRGRLGATYNIGGWNEKANLEVVHSICDLVDEFVPNEKIGSRRNLVKFIDDRPGHDMRYAIDATLIKNELGWEPEETFDTGLRKTVKWYLEMADSWCARVLDGTYQRERLGQLSKA